MRFGKRARPAFAIVVVEMLAWCTACSGPGGTANALAPAMSPSTLSLAPSSLSFLATGTGAAQTFTAGETGFSGSFTVTTASAGSPSSCSGVATVAPSSGSGAFTVTPQSNGHCTFAVSDGSQTTTEAIDVTTTSVGGS